MDETIFFHCGSALATRATTKSRCTSRRKRMLHCLRSKFIDTEKRGTDPVQLKNKKDVKRNKITFLEPFQIGKAGGTYIEPMYDIGKYYFFIAWEARGLDLQEHDIFMDRKVKKYLRAGVNAYHGKYPLDRTNLRRKIGVKMARRLGKLLRPPRVCTPVPGISLNHGQGIIQRYLQPRSLLANKIPLEGLTLTLIRPCTGNLDMDQLEQQRNELLERKRSLDLHIVHHLQEIKKSEATRDEIDPALEEIENIKHGNEP